jgi:hypothetical protein
MPDDIIERAVRTLRRHHAGELQFDEHLRPVRIVVGPDGRIVGPVMVAMIEAADTVLYLPHAEESALQLHVAIEPLSDRGPDGARTDRWRIYHGEPEDVNWAFYAIAAARFEGAVIDGQAFDVPNPMVVVEPRVCRSVNADRRAALAALVRRETTLRIEHPTLVGVDPWGLDVRGPFDVIRVEFKCKVESAQEIEAIVKALLDEVEA